MISRYNCSGILVFKSQRVGYQPNQNCSITINVQKLTQFKNLFLRQSRF